jgi:hypothetical protein
VEEKLHDILYDIMQLHTFPFNHSHTYTHTYTYTHIPTCTHIHPHTHTHTLTHTHTYLHLLRQLVSHRPLLLCRGAQHRTYFVDFVRLVVPWEERPEGVELGHDGTTGPDVDGRVVVHAAKEDLCVCV